MSVSSMYLALPGEIKAEVAGRSPTTPLRVAISRPDVHLDKPVLAVWAVGWLLGLSSPLAGVAEVRLAAGEVWSMDGPVTS
jgi:hypothetical protein